MSDDPVPPAPGLFASLRRIARSLLGLVQTRVELMAIELQEEKLRAISILTWLAVAFALGLGGALVAVGALALFAWRSAGYGGLIALAVGLLGLAAAGVWFVRDRIRRGSQPFAATVAEFRKDFDSLRHEP